MFTESVEQLSLWAMFLGGLVAFVSPCVLPMLPVYTLYLVGSGADGKKNAWLSVLLRCLGLATGFILLFTLIGAGAGLIGGVIQNAGRGTLNIVTGVLMILFGLWTADFLHWGGVKAPKWMDRFASLRPNGFFSALLFGIVIALSWTPCLTPILANALLLAASSATVGAGMLSLAVFALGLSVPMLLFIVLYQWLKQAFAWLRNHQPLLRRIGGILMVVYGIYLILTGVL
ncbi:MAG: cytochrome c biogenesis protein CcdA [Clostridiales bacterium]|nr:cytochrome c biogenesis protein CcdA [Clostridiales bacterium]